jgi:hypothetical protein
MQGKVGQRDPAYSSFITFTITTVGGVGSFSFSTPIHGRCYHRQVTPPNGAGAYSYYVQNTLGIFHDTHTFTGFSECDDLAQYVNESSFWIVNAANDGVYTVSLWLG